MSTETITQNAALSDTVRNMIKDYLDSIPHSKITNLHEMLLEQMEPPLLQAVMEHCRYNQSRAAHVLGLSRGTCRMLLTKYFDEKYCGRREPKEG